MKKLIPLAVASAVLGINSAQAVHVNPDGLGQVLLFPYYTVEGGQDTYINLVNTTNEVKAVKIRFRESMNSAEVLDFNLYMSPYDHWSAAVYKDPDGEGAVIRTADSSCTVPNGLSQGDVVKFKSLDYAGDDAEAWSGIDRTREGYVEVIEMGVATDSDLITAATHIDGVPPGCVDIKNEFQTGVWAKPSGDLQSGLTAGTGGLYGYGVLIDVNEGTDATYDAVALANWNDLDSVHAFPGDSEPVLSDALGFADIIDDNAIVPMDFSGTDAGLEAVSAVLMKSSLLNDYVLEESIAAGTDWVVTFPTKRPYTNFSSSVAPFTSTWNSITGQACEEVGIGYWDREENFIIPEPDDLQYSPRLDEEVEKFSFCHEANVMTFNSSNVLQASVRTALDFHVNFANGWAAIDLDPKDLNSGTPIYNRSIVADDGTEVRGLPVTGFAVQKYVNGELVVDGVTVLSNYAGSVSHKTVVDTIIAP